jgi:hypothetical protein
MPTTFRADVRAGLLTILQAFQSANPTMLRSAHRARPEGFTGDYPIALVDQFGEAIFHTSGVRDRTMNATVSVVGEYRLNAEHMDDFDLLVDALIDFFTTYPHVVSNTVWDRMTVEDYAEEIGDALRPAVRFTFVNLSVQEGRSP